MQLDVTADRPEQAQLGAHVVDLARALVAQAYAVFGAKHYDHYDFLLALSDELSGDTTIEHHRGAEYVDLPDLFEDKDGGIPARDVIAHEYVHSWNGKFRRPADLFTADYNTQPMRDSAPVGVRKGRHGSTTATCWTARAGTCGRSPRFQSSSMLAITVARRWQIAACGRKLASVTDDTTNDEIINPRRPMSWTSTAAVRRTYSIWRAR